MSGSDGDDEELVEIELELDAVEAEPLPSPPVLPPPQSGDVPEMVPEALPEILEVRLPIIEAAEADPEGDRALLEAEAAAGAPADGVRRAGLLLEAARLAERAGDADAALETARRAFAAAPGLPVAFWPLRRLLVRGARWQELADALGEAARAAAPEAAPADVQATPLRGALLRADLLVERGRVLEDRLDRDGDALAAYREALAAVPDHVGALVSLLLLGARRDDAGVRASALGGLARRTADSPRRGALAVEEARAVLATAGGGGAGRAFEILDEELARAQGGRDRSDSGPPVATLLVELERLTAAPIPDEVAARALALLARWVTTEDPPLAVALLRERARLCAGPLGDPAAGLEALDHAARLAPAHPLVAVERIELAERIGMPVVLDERARQSIDDAAGDDDAVDLALLHAEITARGGRPAVAAETLAHPRVRARRAARVDLRAASLALAIEARDPAGLAAELAGVFSNEAASTAAPDVRSRADALAAAAAIRQAWLEDAAGAAALYQASLTLDPLHAQALDALSALLAASSRPSEAAEVLERALAAASSDASNVDAVDELETWARARLVALYADELAQPAAAIVHQRRLVDLAPGDLAARVRLVDLELEAGAAVDASSRAESLIALAAALEDIEPGAAPAGALRVEAGRLLAGASDAGARARGEDLLRAEAALDPGGLAPANLERALETPDARAEIVATELGAAAATEGTPDDPQRAKRRALRFRLAHHYAAAGKYAEALAALTPVRSDGDALARAFSYELARRSGEAILEVAVLSEEARTEAVPNPSGLRLAYGEALERAGDPNGAGAAFRRVLEAAPTGPLAADAALGLLRLAAADVRRGAAALPDAFRAISSACATDDPGLAAASAREAALRRAALPRGAGAQASGVDDLPGALPAEAPARTRAEEAVVRFLGGVRLQDQAAVADALAEMAAIDAASGQGSNTTVALLTRAAARARAAGSDVAERVARRAWQIAHPPALAPMVTDLPPAPVAGGGAAGSAALLAVEQPDPRRPRARRVGGTLAIALNLEAGLDAERRGALGTALAAYGAVIAADPERLEAWTGIRRVARAAGDTVGEARALARLGALIRDPETAAGVLVDAATAYEQAARVDDAITALAKAVELRPAEPVAYERAHALLRADLDSPGRALLLDALLSHRLVAAPLSAGARVAVLFERAQHRAQRLGARAEAIDDWKEILGLQPEHREALYHLAATTLAEEDRAGAAQWLERFLSVARDDGRIADARLDLAGCYEATGDRARAIETLKGAAAARPGDARPLEQLAELHLRLGDWRRAVEVLRASEARLPETGARAALHLRIGAVLRDMGRDGPGAAAAFRTAAELDPLGEGTRALVALFDATKSPRGALETIEREIADIRRALTADPLDQRRLERLGEYLAMARTRGSTGPIADAELATASVLALVRNLWQPPTEAQARVPARPLVLPAKSARAFWAALADPAASGFIAEVWPHIVEAAASLFPIAQPRDRRTAVAIGDPRFTWIRASAATLGLPDLALFVARDATVPWVVAIEEPGPGMVLAPGAEGAPEARFFIGRALGLLLQRATLLERVSPDDLAPVFASAAVVAGSTSTPAALAAPPEDILRAVTRTIGRKDRKALALQASRFAFEALDLAVWQEAVVRTAERLGLLVTDDVGLAAVSLAAEGNGASRAPLPDGAGAASAVATSPPALDVIRFALGDQYPVLRRAVSDAAASIELSGETTDGRPGSGPGGRG